MDELKELAKEIAAAIREKDATGGSERLARLEQDYKHLDESVEGLKKKVYNEHDTIVIWVKDFIESYRRVVTVVVTSGLLAIISLLIHLYGKVKGGQ